MNATSEKTTRQPSATDLAFNLAIVPVRECRGDVGSIACVLLAAFTLCYVFAFLPLAFVFKWVVANNQTTPTDQPKRRWFRFSLRTLFVVVTALCVALGWFVWQMQIVHERQAVLTEIQRLAPGSFHQSLEAVEAKAHRTALQKLQSLRGYCRIPRLRRMLGDESFVIIGLPEAMSPAWIERAEYAFPEAEIKIYGDEPIRRDSLYKPVGRRKPNQGAVFMTGLIEE